MSYDTYIRKVTIREEPIGWVYRKDIPPCLKVSRHTYTRWLRKIFAADPGLKATYNRRGEKSKFTHVDDFVVIVKRFTECERVEIVFLRD